MSGSFGLLHPLAGFPPLRQASIAAYAQFVGKNYLEADREHYLEGFRRAGLD